MDGRPDADGTGLDRVLDVARLEEDKGLRMESQVAGLSRRRLAERFRRGRARIFPLSGSLHGWLERFHRSGVFDEALRRLVRLGFASSGSSFATIDLDATIIRSFKKDCESTYRAVKADVPGERGYQALIAFCSKIGMVLHAEMRAGNVPASKGNLEALEVALGRLPESVEGVMLRTDGAGYQERIIHFCKDPSVRPEPLRCFVTISLVTGAPRQKALMDEVARLPEDAWCPMPAEDGVWRGLEVAEIGFASNMWARQKAGHVMRIVVTRQEFVGELGTGLDNIPATGRRPVYKVRGNFTNIPAPGATAAELAGGLEPRDGEEIVRLAHDVVSAAADSTSGQGS